MEQPNGLKCKLIKTTTNGRERRGRAGMEESYISECTLFDESGLMESAGSEMDR